MLRRRKHVSPAIPTASMADIAFLLIIFFLTSTSMNQDKGLSLHLPALGAGKEVPTRSICNLWINQNDEVAVFENNRLAPLPLSGLRAEVTRRLTENENLIVSVKTERQATYRAFVNVLDELKLAGATRITIADPETALR